VKSHSAVPLNQSHLGTSHLLETKIKRIFEYGHFKSFC